MTQQKFEEAAVLALHYGASVTFWAGRVEHLASAEADGDWVPALVMAPADRVLALELANTELAIASAALGVATTAAFDLEQASLEAEMAQFRGRLAFDPQAPVAPIETIQNRLGVIAAARAEMNRAAAGEVV